MPAEDSIALLSRIYRLLEAQRFREYSLGWFRGYIVVPDYSIPGFYYRKRLKRVNRSIRYYGSDFVSAYPDGIITGYHSTDDK